MKNTLNLILFFCFPYFIFSQKYEFDYLIKDYMENHKNGYKNANDHFINSKNRKYYGRFSPSNNNGYLLTIYDYSKNLLHTFEISKNDSPNDASKYKYLYSGYILPNEKAEKVQKEQVYTHTFLNEISGGKRILIRKFSNSKDKKPDVEMIGEFIEIDADLRPFSYTELFANRADLVNLPDVENFYLRYAKWKVKDSEGEYHTNIYKIPLTLILDPNKIKLPKEKPKSAEETIEEIKRSIIR